MLIAQMTDMHVKPEGVLTFGTVDTAACLARSVDHLNELRPDVVLVTGDLASDGRPQEYATLRQILSRLAAPAYLIPGNHDDRANLRAAFPDHRLLHEGGAFAHYVVEGWPVRLVGLDTTVPGEAGGLMCEARLAWLDAQLAAAPEAPTVIFMHHPPFRTGIGYMDALGLANSEAMGAIIRRNKQVERILCGHVHRPVQVRWCGTLASIAPGTAHQMVLDLAPDAPSRWRLEPPAVQLHLWRADTGLISHTSTIGDFGPARPFTEDGDPA